MIQLTGTLQSIAGGAAEIGQVLLQLHGYGSQTPRVSGTALLARTSAVDVPIDPLAGSFAVLVYGNDAITPPGTYYTLKTLDDNGDVAQIMAYTVTGGGVLDISAAVPFDPTNIPPPYIPAITNQIVTLAFTLEPVFNGAAGLTFEFALAGNVLPGAAVFTGAVPGNLYTFILTQDQVGGRTFQWPANIRNGAAVNRIANSLTVQTFVARSDASLDAIGGAIYYP